MQDTEKTLHRICGFLNEEFLPAMLEVPLHDKNMEEEKQDNSHKQHLRSSASAVKSQVAFTQLFAGRDLRDFGYSVQPVALSAGERVKFSVIDLPANLAGLIAWNLTERREFLGSVTDKEI
jgi:hypothetical protein